ncbi:unnamed protein product, partial [Effrenium voratum]
RARLVPNGRDLRKYARLFVRTDQDSDGFISADEVRSLFNKSYLPQETLIQIFNLSHVGAGPGLGFVEFVAAMHLIRLARQGHAPALGDELMAFLGSLRDSPRDLAVQGTSRSARDMARGNPSANAAPAFGAPSPSPSQPQQRARPVPNGRDLRKYARLFVRTDQDSDGFISADEVRSLFNKSYLPQETLIQIFNLSHVGAGPGLGFVEFVAAMHLIRLARQGHAPALGDELMAFLGSLRYSPRDLAVQGTSKSARDMARGNPSANAAPAFGAPSPSPSQPQPSHTELADWGAQAEAPAEFPLDFPEPSQPEPKDKKKEKKRKKDKGSTEGMDGMDGVEAFGQSNWTSFGEAPKEPEPKPPVKSKAKPKVELGARVDAYNVSFSPLASATTRRDPPTSSGRRTRLGLPLEPEPTSSQDPDYLARMEEILGPRKPKAPALPPQRPREVWAGRRNDGHFEERYRRAYQDLGDYGSGNIFTSLMGAQPRREAARVLPQPAKPFLKSLTPNFQVDWVS